MVRLVQIRNGRERRVALVEEPCLRLLALCSSVYELAGAALASGRTLSSFAEKQATTELLDYETIYQGASDWKLMTPIDHPIEPSRCLVTGTGLTHFGSARDRDAMHTRTEEELTDSMKMFRLGVEKGRAADGEIGAAPEWFYKGTGSILKVSGESLDVPSYAEDGGEEAEIAGIYLIGPDGRPCRLGLAMGNEFSDHRFEKKNYLNLAGSKLRNCALGPELVLDAPFQSVPGEVKIERGGSVIWSKAICTGEAEMCHSLRNIEHHHFKFEGHRRPGDVHVHFFGAHSLSFGSGLELTDGDLMSIRFEGFGRALLNPLSVPSRLDPLITVFNLG